MLGETGVMILRNVVVGYLISLATNFILVELIIYLKLKTFPRVSGFLSGSLHAKLSLSDASATDAQRLRM